LQATSARTPKRRARVGTPWKKRQREWQRKKSRQGSTASNRITDNDYEESFD